MKHIESAIEFKTPGRLECVQLARQGPQTDKTRVPPRTATLSPDLQDQMWMGAWRRTRSDFQNRLEIRTFMEAFLFRNAGHWFQILKYTIWAKQNTSAGQVPTAGHCFATSTIKNKVWGPPPAQLLWFLNSGKEKKLCSKLLLISEPSEIKCSLPRSIWMKSRSCKSDQFVPLEIIESKTGHQVHPTSWLLGSISRWYGGKAEGQATPSDPNTHPPTHASSPYPPPTILSYSRILSALASLLVTKK